MYRQWLRSLILVIQVIFTWTADMNRIKSLNVKCGDQDMLVDIEFNQPFNGILFSKGYFARNECVYIKAAPSKYTYQFTIAYQGCGTTAGGSGIAASGARRSDGFLRSSDESDENLVANATRSRRDVGNSSAPLPLAQGRSLGGFGGGMGMFGGGGGMGGGMGQESFGDPYAPSMQNQDYSGGVGGGNMADPYAGGQMGGAGQGQQQYWQPGPEGGNSAYSSGMPIYSQNQNGYGGGNQQGYAAGGNNMQYNSGANVQQNNGEGAWDNGQQQNSGQVANQDNKQNFQSNNNVQSSVNSQSQSGSGGTFAASFPGASDAGQTQFVDQSQSTQLNDNVQTTSLAKTNQPFTEDRTGGSSRFFENIIIIQYDANIQEVWDVAKALRCEWHDNYHKTVSYKPFQVDSLEVVPATFAGDNVGVWMTVQQGKGPYAPEVNGIVRIGEYLTLAIGIQDKTKKFDMRVINCFASDGARPAIQLVDEFGCVTRPKIMSDIAKVVNYGDQASVVSYAYFQAFKFPDSVDVHLDCSVEICKFGCAKQCYNKLTGDAGSSSSKKSSGSSIASISSDFQLGGSRGQLSRKIEGSSSSSSGMQSSADDSQSSSVSASGKSKSVSGSASATSGKALFGSAFASSGKSASGSDSASSGSADVDSNEGSVSKKVKTSLQNGNIVVKVATNAPSAGSAGAALYNAMGSEDDSDSDDVTTKKVVRVATSTATTTTQATTKKTKKAKKVMAEGGDEDDSAYRRRRREAGVADKDTQQNVGIKRTIRVVAPGDLSFFDSNRNNTIVYASSQRIVGQNDVCISPPSFVAGIVVLVTLLIVTTLIAIVLCLRLRSLDRVSNKLKEVGMEYINHTL